MTLNRHLVDMVVCTYAVFKRLNIKHGHEHTRLRPILGTSKPAYTGNKAGTRQLTPPLKSG